MTSTLRLAAAIVAAHFLVGALHGQAHQTIPVPVSPAQNAFITLVIVLAPFLALGFLWTRFRTLGATLLTASMAGSLVFGLYYHFIASSPDHVSQVPADGWGALFQSTAVLLMVSEAIGLLVGLRMLEPPRRRSALRVGGVGMR